MRNFFFTGKDVNEIDHDEIGDDTMGSDMDDHMSDNDSKKDGSRSGGESGKGSSSKPRRLVAQQQQSMISEFFY